MFMIFHIFTKKLPNRRSVKAGELRRYPKKHGCTFHTHKGGSGHLTVRLGDRTSQLPTHGSHKELGRKLIAKIKKDLGLR